MSIPTHYSDGYPPDGEGTDYQVIYDAQPDPDTTIPEPRIRAAFRYLDHTFAIRQGGQCQPRQLTPLEASVEDAALITIQEYLQPQSVNPEC